MNIRPVADADVGAICRIYNHYILETIATFEEQAISSDEMAGRTERILAASLPWLIAERQGEVAGFAYASRWNERHGYRFSLETTIYMDPAVVARGLGRKLYESLLDKLRDDGFHVAIGGIALPNEASVALHERLGFRKVAHFHQVGIKFGQWIDVGYWQASL